MMSIEQIEAESRRAARQSAARKVAPLIIWAADIERAKSNQRSAVNELPNIGDRCPKGWRRVRLDESFDENRRGIFMGDARGYGAFMVDASGMGSEDEPALMYDEFVQRLRPNFGYAIIEVGQFQVKIGVFEQVHEGPAHKAARKVIESATLADHTRR
jgi:hypothetical protein